jgi:hypothetical protein
MPAKKKAKRKTGKRVASSSKRRKRKVAAKPKSTGDLVVRVAEQMAGVVAKGLDRTLAKLPRRGTTAAAKAKLKDAIAALRRQAEAFREQAQVLEARGAEGAAGVWRPLAERLERAATELGRRLSG